MSAVDYIHLPSGSATPPIGQVAPYKAIVVVEQEVSPEWRSNISSWLVETGCHYMMAWGVGCSEWDDSVDWASLDKDNFQMTSDDDLIMTTWHNNEPLDDVFRFAKVANHPTITLDRVIIIDVSEAHRRDDIIGRYENAR